jgi:hypothetical protein
MGAGFSTLGRTVTARRRVLAAGTIMLAVLALKPLAAQTILQKAERDEIVIVAQNDPVMTAAMRKGRESLAEWRSPRRRSRAWLTLRSKLRSTKATTPNISRSTHSLTTTVGSPAGSTTSRI